MENMPLSKKEYLAYIKSFQGSSKKYMEQYLYPQWRKNENIYHMIHENSKLYDDPRYSHRSKLYIPKARNAMVRKLAAFIGTYFGNPDIVSITPRKKKDPVMHLAAKLIYAVVNYRLKHTLKFFMNCLFAWQDMMKYGNGAVQIGWDYTEKESVTTETVPIFNEEGELESTEEREITTLEVIEDQPSMRHVHIWNLFIAPSADPIDPVNTSPCLVEKIPYYLYEARKKWESGDWKKPEDLDVNDDNSMFQYIYSPSEFEMETYNDISRGESKSETWQQIEVWKCFVNIDGKDVYFLSLKADFMLIDPEYVEEKWPCKGRPYVVGGSIPDSGSSYWTSFLETTEGLQREINAIRNQRRDNVTLALNKKLLIRESAGLDINSLLYSRPGAPIIGKDISDLAVRELVYQDVTGSSYKEQEMNEIAFEELTGITPYNMGTQRPGMNKTATGVSILTEEANTLIAMELRIINETFMLPALEIIVQFEQQFENEEVLRHVADQEGIDFDGVWSRDAIEGKYDVEVNAGVGSTSREVKFRNLGMIIDRMMAINSQYGAPVMNIIEAVREALPLAGHENPDRFINSSVIAMIMSKFGQVAQQSILNPNAPPPQLMNAANSGGNQIPGMAASPQVESGQGFGGEQQIYR